MLCQLDWHDLHRSMFSPLNSLPVEILCNILQHVSITDLHSSVRRVSKHMHNTVDYILSNPSTIDHINRRYGVMWTLGGYAPSLKLHGSFRAAGGTRKGSDPMKMSVLFDAAADTPFSRAGSGMTPVLCGILEHGLVQGHSPEEGRYVQIFFNWSIHTVYSARVWPILQSKHLCIMQGGERGGSHLTLTDKQLATLYLGQIDYRLLLNWIVNAQKSHVSQWFISQT